MMLPLEKLSEGSRWKTWSMKAAYGVQHHWWDGSSRQWPAQKHGQSAKRRMNALMKAESPDFTSGCAGPLLMPQLSWSLKPFKAAI